MTKDPKLPAPAIDVADFATRFFVEQADYVARAETLLPLNKSNLFDALAAAGITRVVVTFDGCGDSGQIEDITFHACDTTVSAPQTEPVTIASTSWASTDISNASLTIEQALELLAYDLLSQTHGGWENNDGAYGEFVFDVADRTILLDHNDRYMAVESYAHEF